VKMTIYISDDLAAEVKAGLEDTNVSAICQDALRAELERKRTGGEPAARYLTRTFTQTIDDYLVWLEGQIGPFAGIAPRQLAGLSISLYRQFQISPERRAARGLD